MVVLPFARAVTLPYASTAAMAGSLLVQVRVVTAFTGLSTTFAPSACVSPMAMIRSALLIFTLLGLPSTVTSTVFQMPLLVST